MKSRIEDIRDLEKNARLLEPDTHMRKVLRNKMVAITESFLDNLIVAPAYKENRHSIEELEEPFTEEGSEANIIFERIVNAVDTPGINPASGNHLGYIPGGGLYTSALGDYWADVTNRYSGIFFADPGAAKVENELIRWMIGLVGYPESAWGNLASGGSISNLTAIIAAREAMNITPENIRNMVVYYSAQTHHSNMKAFRIAGLHHAKHREIKLQDNLKIDPKAFEQLVQSDKEEGLTPFLLVSSAGTTDAGIIDPIEELAETCSKNGIWHHIDAAYGGFFLLSDSLREKLKHVEKSDSIVLDPHKGLFLPYGLGVVLVRSTDHLKAAFSYEANYMQDAMEDEDEISPAEVSPELTKHFRGLRMWLPLKLHGLKPFRSALEEKYLLARYFFEKIQKIEHFETFAEPEISVVMFRYHPVDFDTNTFNRHLIHEIHKDGTIFLSTTTINADFWLRVAILVFRTHIDTIDLTIRILEEKVELLKARLNIGNVGK